MFEKGDEGATVVVRRMNQRKVATKASVKPACSREMWK
jgi:hypothetical protein